MNNSRNVLTSVLVLVVGVVFIFMQGKANVINAIVSITGVLFLVAGGFNVIMLMAGRKAEKPKGSSAGYLTSLAAIALGLWMVLDPGALVSVVVYLFAGLLVVGGAYHVYMLAYGFRPLRFPVWFYILPSLMVIGGVVVFSVGATSMMEYIVLVAGVAMVIFAVSTFLEIAGRSSYDRAVRNSGSLTSVEESEGESGADVG